VGIGRPAESEGATENDSAIIDYVLRDFAPEEKSVIAEVMPRVSEAIACLLDEGLTAAMNRYN